jgi:NADP-dependent 3-hydroxy acid dehydrogenase YdfG
VVARRVAAGDAVLVVGRDRAEVDRLVARVGRGASGAVVDATDRRSVDAFFLALGNLDHLVLVHGDGRGAGPFATLPIDDLRAGLEAELVAQLGVAQAVLPTLAATGSITFVAARAAVPGAIGIAAINGAVEASVRSLALELAPRRVNRVAPAADATPADDVAAAIGRCLDDPGTTGWIVDVAATASSPSP